MNEENEEINLKKSLSATDAVKPCTPSKSKFNGVAKTPTTKSIRPFSTPGRPMTATKMESSKTPFTPSEGSITSREAARLAKEMSTCERIQRVAIQKDKWAKERAQKFLKHKIKREEELKRQQEILVLAAEQRRMVLEKQREMDEKKKQIERELLVSSLDARAQLAKDLEQQRKERRRQSIALNNEIMTRALDRQRELSNQKKREEDSLLESRKEDFEDIREAKKKEADRRRESMVSKTKSTL